MDIASQQKKTFIEVNEREVAYFQKNYPLHHAVLLDLVKRGDARIITDAEGST